MMPNRHQRLIASNPSTTLRLLTLPYVIGCVFIGLSLQTAAQQAQPVFRHLNIENGLSNNYVPGIGQDAQGFLWIATQFGLNRYDGSKVVHFLHDPTDSTSISSNELKNLEVAADGRIWIVLRGGIDCYDPRTEIFTHYDFTDDISTVLHDNSHGLWVGTSRGIVLLDTATGKQEEFPLPMPSWLENPSRFKIQNLLIGEDQSLWAATNVGVYRLNIRNKSGEWILPCADETLLASADIDARDIILAGEEGKMWVASKQGLLEIAPRTSCLVPFTVNGKTAFKQEFPNSLVINKNGLLWLGASETSNVLTLDPRNGHIETLGPLTAEQQNFAEIADIFIDESGLIWMCSRGNGIHIYDPKTRHFRWFEHSFNHQGTTNDPFITNEVFEDSQGVRWICTDEGLEWADASGAATYPKLVSTLKRINTWVGGIKEAEAGIFWVASEIGPIRLDAGDGSMQTYFERPESLGGGQNNIATVVHIDHQQNTWLGFWGGGMVFINRNTPDQPKRFFSQPGSPTELPARHLQAIVEAADGTIWIGMAYGGLVKYEPDSGRFTQHLHDASDENTLAYDYVRTLALAADGKLWVGTFGGGLDLFDPLTATFQHHTQKDGLADDLIFDLAEDEQGYLWILTATAISKLDPKTGVFQNFDADDGMPKTQYNELTGPHPVSGDILMATDRGYIAFHPDSITVDTQAPYSQIIKLERYRREGEFILEKGIGYKKEIHLSYEDYIINLELAALTPREADRAQMAYKLEGFQNEWIQLGDRRQISFTSLPAKKYTLLVKSANSDGIWNNTPTRLAIIVHPPWWRTVWAYGLYLLAATGIIWLFWRRELRRIRLRNELEKQQLESARLEELDQVKTHFLTNISHEFRTPLTVILGMTEEIKTPATKNLIQKSSQNLLRLVNQLLDFSKLEAGKLKLHPVPGNLIAFLQYLLESFHSLAQHKNVQLKFSSTQNRLIMDFDEEKVQHIISNLLSNAIKFTPRNGIVELFIDRSAAEVIIQVKDNGIGIPEAELTRVFERFYQIKDPMSTGEPGTGIGLTFTRELVELMEGKIELKSQVGVGSAFTVRLPIQQAGSKPVSPPPVEVAAPPEQLVHDTQTEPINGDKTQLLLIEDNPEVVAYIQTILRAEYDIMVAENGVTGIEKAIEFIPDIIISDVMMPLKDGLAVTQFLKNDERTSHIPIVLLTAKADTNFRLAGLERGADAYLAKPFNRRELRIRLQRLVELRQKLQARYTQTTPLQPSDDPGIQIEDAFLQKLNGIIEARLQEAEFNVSELCQEMHMSRSQLFRKLKALTDQSITAYLRSIRLRKARALLLAGEQNVTEVAFAVGFNDPRYFSRVFSQEFGHAPSSLL